MERENIQNQYIMSTSRTQCIPVCNTEHNQSETTSGESTLNATNLNFPSINLDIQKTMNSGQTSPEVNHQLLDTRENRNRRKNENEWKCNIRERLRQSGQEYISTKGSKRNARKVGISCGISCRFKFKIKIPIEARKNIL